MQYICREIDGVTDWYYKPEEQRYYKLDKKQNVIARIAGQYLPDPYELERQYALQAELLSEERRKAHRVKCSPVTHLLWQHWQGVRNANVNDQL